MKGFQPLIGSLLLFGLASAVPGSSSTGSDKDNESGHQQNRERATTEKYHNGNAANGNDGDDDKRINRNLATYEEIATIVPLADHPLPDEAAKNKLAEKWGHWHFWDGDANLRPEEDYLSKYPNKDIPADDFLEEAWQADAVFVNHYLNDADQLITRAMEAIFTEYGHGKPLPPQEEAARFKMFHWTKLEEKDEPIHKVFPKYDRRGDKGDGGWTDQQSFDGLVRRLLHAMMTSDTFTVVMGGHSSAAGHGNHFRQSYMMQFHKIMQPIFARLGVKLITRNMAQGGLGTIQHAMGFKSIYGDEIDIFIWDAEMTEGGHRDHQDMLFHQAITSGKRIPLFLGGDFDVLTYLQRQAGADIGELGYATDGIPTVQSRDHAERDMTWAARYIKCDDDVSELCEAPEYKFRSKCWVDRADGVKPSVTQDEHLPGQVSWNQGWRMHQLRGRNLAMAVLQALRTAVSIWTENVRNGPPLADELWHVTDYYKAIRDRLVGGNVKVRRGECAKIKNQLPDRLCFIPLKARTQYTPRANPEQTSLTSIIKVSPEDTAFQPKNNKAALYDGPDAHNDFLDVPEGAIDVYDIVVGRRRQLEQEQEVTASPPPPPPPPKVSPERVSQYTNRTLAGRNDIVTGRGWQLIGEPQGYCDGTYNAVCGRSTDNTCVLSGHHDGRGAIVGNEYSGWLVMTLEDLYDEIIIIKLHTWHNENDNTITKGWTSVNNAKRGRHQRRRRLRQSHHDDNYHENFNNATTTTETFDTKHVIHSSSSSSSAFSYDDDFFYVANETDTNVQEDFTKIKTKRKKKQERKLQGSTQGLSDVANLPDTFQFDFAIDGEITTWNKEEFLSHLKKVQRMVETLTLMDVPKNYRGKRTDEPRTVELAIRMRGCGRQCTFGLTHVYWA